MDNILFVPETRELAWLDEMFPDVSPAELPVGGRRVIDYALECAQKFGVMFTEIIDWKFSQKLADDFADMTRTGYPVFYLKGEGPAPRGLKDIEGYSSPLTDNISDGLVVVWGPAVSMHTPGDITLEPVPEEECIDTPAGMYRREGGRWMRILPHGLVIRNVKAWHALNFAILHHPGQFTLPGYSAEKGVYLGQNVVLEKGTEVRGPVLLQDNTWCARNVRLDGDVIINSGSFVSEGARLKRTVVAHDTFIGAGLDLEGKIVVGRRIIDAETGAWTDIEEPGVARRIGSVHGWLRSMWHFLRGRSYGRRG